METDFSERRPFRVRWTLIPLGLGAVALLVCLAAYTFGVPNPVFPYSRYKPADLDELLSQARPESGSPHTAPQKLYFTVTLQSYPALCDAGALKKAMVSLGAKKDAVDQAGITKSIAVNSPKGASVKLFIRDKAASSLAREVSLGESVFVYCDYVYMSSHDPGILVNEFQRIGK
jgi:hypothetical protein